jgi:hypothetical protein
MCCFSRIRVYKPLLLLLLHHPGLRKHKKYIKKEAGKYILFTLFIIRITIAPIECVLIFFFSIFLDKLNEKI